MRTISSREGSGLPCLRGGDLVVRILIFPEATQAAGGRAEAERQGLLLPVISGPRESGASNSRMMVGEEVHCLVSKKENKSVHWITFISFYFFFFSNFPPGPHTQTLVSHSSPTVLFKQIGSRFPLTFPQPWLDLDPCQATWPSSSSVHIIFMMFILN